MQVVVLHNQSLLDIAIQHIGNVENAFAIAVANGLSVTSEVIVGTALMIPTEAKKENDVWNYYQAKKIQPATCASTAQVPAGKGIGWMQIGNSFKVN